MRKLFSMFFFLYRFVFAPSGVLLVKFLAFLKVSPKLVDLVQDRKAPLPDFSGPCILVHAASGEIEYAKPVLRELRKRSPKKKIVVSYFSPSAKRLLMGIDADVIVPMPFDLSVAVKVFLDRFQPVAVLIARSDLWPEFLIECRRRQITTILFSATFDITKRGFFKSFVLDQLSLVFAVSELDAEAFQKLTSTPVICGGDTRYDQVAYRLSHPRKISLIHRKPDSSTGKKIFVGVLGSTWPEDENQWLPAIRELKNLNVQVEFRWIIAPHEISTALIRKLQLALEELQLSLSLFSAGGIWSTNVLLVDQVGYLADLYAWGDFAFVGGSFRKKIHSVMEPLAHGIPVLVGPLHTNNREAVEFQKVTLRSTQESSMGGAVTVVHSTAEIVAALRPQGFILSGNEVRAVIRAEILRRTQASEKLVVHLSKTILLEPN